MKSVYNKHSCKTPFLHQERHWSAKSYRDFVDCKDIKDLTSSTRGMAYSQPLNTEKKGWENPRPGYVCLTTRGSALFEDNATFPAVKKNCQVLMVFSHVPAI